jgi:tRNA nucleotidyltransferase (CCA-adding enzyme)
VRFEQRYNFRIESQTLVLAKNAIKAKMLAKLSADRVREELKHILGENSPTGAVLRMKELNIWPFILPQANIGEDTVGTLKNIPAAIGFFKDMQVDLDHVWVVYLSALVRLNGSEISGVNERLRLTKEEQRILSQILCHYQEIVERLSCTRPMKMSEIAAVVRRIPVEAYTYILACSTNDAVKERLKNYLARSRHNKLLINGDDIKNLGFSPGPHFKEALDAVKDARLDGQLQTREEAISFVRQYMLKAEGKERG